MSVTDLKPKAFLFDLNGTIINDMEYHTLAWHAIMNDDLGKSISYADVKKEMYGKNAEVLERVFGTEKFTQEQVEQLSIDKEKRYQALYMPHLALINGLDTFFENARQKQIKMAIGSAAIPFNIDFVLDGLNIRHYFKAVVSADDVKISKPNAETFLKAAEALGAEPKYCIVFEDAPKGVESAANAGMQCIVLTTTHEIHEFSEYNNIIAFIDDFSNPILNTLF
ncbi:HAD family phosphatase [Pedobacter aquatilis]|uniref:HAD family hydrolase n=1 Tax=Pedobacter aquatilis TaxID=351343 RepID=UPI0025B54ABA|nr:HAD family phosphatase [Pedobacter aquatilis]MDN3588608.1 HAD family phosphatase [Pedobacter aquatilis]